MNEAMQKLTKDLEDKDAEIEKLKESQRQA